MRLGKIGLISMGMAIVAFPGLGWAQSAATPTPGTGSNPGAAATEAIVNPARPPADIAPPAAPPTASPTPPGRVQYSAPPSVDPAVAQPQGALSPAEIRALLDASAETAKATREAVDYGRVVPDILSQVLAKLDKLENKLDKIENILRGQGGRRR